MVLEPRRESIVEVKFLEANAKANEGSWRAGNTAPHRCCRHLGTRGLRF